MYVGIGRHFLHDSGHFTRYLIIGTGKDKNLSDRVFLFEIFAGNALGDYDLSRHRKAGLFITFQKLEIEKTEKARIGISYLVFPQRQLTILHNLFWLEQRADSGIIFNSRKILFHCRAVSERAACPVIGQHLPFAECTLHTVNMGIFRVHLVKTELKSYIRQNQ